MKVLVVNHGYPLKFNAGSEIYTQNLVHGLISKKINVQVFSRDENPFLSDYDVTTEYRFSPDNIKYKLSLVNVPRQKDRYQSDGVDVALEKIINEFRPDIVHLNHLNHLSLGIVDIIFKYNIPIIFTLHDFWLACPRGQFLQINYGETPNYQLCDGQDNNKCAVHCYSRYFSGLNNMLKTDINYWEKWVDMRQKKILSIIDKVNLFIAPSNYLKNRMIKELPTLSNKIRYLDYGFDLNNLKNRDRKRKNDIIFGYIGTHIVAKGIILLLKAFINLHGNVKLRIYGRYRPGVTNYLKSLYSSPKIEWYEEYENKDIIKKVFNNIDIIVVPSIWAENSPLVIHEAQQARVPVITADYGGMSEYVKHKVNGLLFKHRDYNSLTEQMQYLIDNPELIEKLGQKGYLYSKNGDIPSIDDHIDKIINIYKEVLK